jgi:hypothetical protein
MVATPACRFLLREAQIAGAGAYDPYTPALSASSYMMWDEGGIDADRPDALWCSVFCCP